MASSNQGLLFAVLPEVPTIGLMRMPCIDVTPNLPGFTIAKTSGFNPLIHDLACHQEPRRPHCGLIWRLAVSSAISSFLLINACDRWLACEIGFERP